jgi:hypothetical protein
MTIPDINIGRSRPDFTVKITPSVQLAQSCQYNVVRRLVRARARKTPVNASHMPGETGCRKPSQDMRRVIQMVALPTQRSRIDQAIWLHPVILSLSRAVIYRPGDTL